MGLTLFKSYTLESLQLHGFDLPDGVNGWFVKAQEVEGYALLFKIKPPNYWCSPPIDDRHLCSFYTPSGLRFGVNCCQNNYELLSFRTATFGLPIENSRIHLFASIKGMEWYYLGESILGSGYGKFDSFNQFDFKLSEKLPEWLWLQFGGYKNWLICTENEQFLVANDIEADWVLMENWGTISPTLEITRYKEDSLFAVTNINNDAVITYHFGEKRLHSVSSRFGAEKGEYYGFGNYEFPIHWVIPRSHAITLIRRFLNCGLPVGLVE